MSRTTPSRVSGLLALVAAFPSAQAHPGHALGEAGLSHLLTSPDHFSVLAAGGLLMLGAAGLARREQSRRLLCRGGAVALLGAVVCWSLRA